MTDLRDCCSGCDSVTCRYHGPMNRKKARRAAKKITDSTPRPEPKKEPEEAPVDPDLQTSFELLAGIIDVATQLEEMTCQAAPPVAPKKDLRDDPRVRRHLLKKRRR